MSRKKTHEEFVSELAEVRPGLEALSLYNGAHNPVVVFCSRCGSLWITTPRSLSQRHGGCKHCRGTHTSFQESVILESFREALPGEQVKHRDTDTIGEEIDVLIPSLGFAVEPGAWVFHQNRTERDSMKRAACQELGIRLVTVYMGCKDEQTMRELEEDNVIVTRSDCVQLFEMKVLRLLVEQLFQMAGLSDVTFTEEQWDDIRTRAAALCGSERSLDYCLLQIQLDFRAVFKAVFFHLIAHMLAPSTRRQVRFLGLLLRTALVT